MKAKILVAASSKTRANILSRELSFLNRDIDMVVGSKLPSSFEHHRLLVCEIGKTLRSPSHLLEKLHPDAHVILIIPQLDVRWVAYYMQDNRVNHFLTQPVSLTDLHEIADKLETGDIFGIERYFPEQTSANISVQYQRFSTFANRCKALEDLETYAQKQKVRSHVRRTTVQICEELLMNAMYQAPMDDKNSRVFQDVEPKVRIKRKTPRPISLRYAIHEQSLFLSVRDRYGTFIRNNLAHYLLRCATSSSQIEDKKLGAGLGLYLVASNVNRFIINVLPGSVAEFICIVDKADEKQKLKVLSITTQRTLQKKNENGLVDQPRLPQQDEFVV